MISRNIILPCNTMYGKENYSDLKQVIHAIICLCWQQGDRVQVMASNRFGSFLNIFSKHINHAVPLCSELPFPFTWITLIDSTLIIYFYSCLPLTHSPHSSYTIFLKQKSCYIFFPLNCFNCRLILLRQRANPVKVFLEAGQFAWPSFFPTSPPRYSLCQQL